VNLFEISWGCLVLQELCGYIIFVSISPIRKKWILACSPKKFLKKWISFLKYYVLSIREALIHSIWTRDEKVIDNLSFLGNLSILKRTFCPTLNANIFQSNSQIWWNFYYIISDKLNTRSYGQIPPKKILGFLKWMQQKW